MADPPGDTVTNDARQSLADAFEEACPSIKVQLKAGPSSTDSLRSLLASELPAGESTPDVYDGDIVWPYAFAHYGYALPPTDSPEATFIALAGEEVVGFAKLSLTAPTAAGHAMTAVKRAWRGRGIAGALKATEINWALANGYTELHTSNEERNAPINRLNARLGYRPGIGRIHLVGPSLVDSR